MRAALRSFFSSIRPIDTRKQKTRSRHAHSSGGWRAAAAESLENRTLLAAQLIASDAPVKPLSAGEFIDIPVIYQTLDDSDNPAALQANLIDFNLHFDNDALDYVESSSFFAEGIFAIPNTERPESGVAGDDSDADTETVLTASYTDNDVSLALGWPNSPSISGQQLYIARFQAKPGFSGTTINFSANATGNVIGQAAQFEFQSTSVTLEAPAPPPTVSIANAAAVEEGQSALFAVSLSAASDETVTVNYSTADGDGPTGALGGQDFTGLTNQTVTFNPGETQKNITVVTTDDPVVESTETFGVTLNSATGATLGTSQAVGTITDNDTPQPTLSISDAAAVTEGGNSSFTVTLSAESQTTVTVTYSTAETGGPTTASAGVDYVSQTSQTLTFNPGETQKSITVATIDDPLVEQTEEFRVLLTSPAGATLSDGVGFGRIRDNDVPAPSLSIADAPTVTEGASASFTVTLDAAASSTVMVNYSTNDGNGPNGAIGGEDFTAQTNQTLTFLAGETEKTISVSTTDDDRVEPSEMFTVTLFSSVGAVIGTGSATGTIDDNDVLTPTLSVSDATAVLEGASAVFTVSLSSSPSSPVTVTLSTADGSGPNAAISSSDFTPLTNHSITFNPGQTQKTVSVATLEDLVLESPETFFLNVLNANGVTIVDSQGVGTIDNVLVPLPIISIADADGVTEGEDAVFTISINGPVPYTVSGTYSTSDGLPSATPENTAVAGQDYEGRTNQSFTISPGQTSISISIPTIDDTVDEAAEYFQVALANLINVDPVASENLIADAAIGDNDPSADTASIHGRKWDDSNGNGERDAGETWLNGWTIQILDSNGQVVGEQLTMDVDVNGDEQIDPETERGWYWFSDIAPGTYSVREVAQQGWRQTYPGDDLAARAYELDTERQFRETASDFKNWGGLDEIWFIGGDDWHFVTPDGSLFEWDGSERNNLTGTLVELFTPDYYADPSLLYDAPFAEPGTRTLVLSAGEIVNDVDFGNTQIDSGSIHGRKWHDLNGDGRRSSNEPWLNGWTIQLVGPEGIVVETTTMDMDLDDNGQIDPETESGWYWFNDVAAGTWIVREPAVAGWEQTSPQDPELLQAYELDQELGLRFSRSLFRNWGGLDEIWILGDSGWYFMTPDGSFYEWNGSPRTALTGNLLTQISARYHSEPALLYDAPNPFEYHFVIRPGEIFDDVDFGNRKLNQPGQPSVDFPGRGNVSVRIDGDNLILTGDGSSNGVDVFTNGAGHVAIRGFGDTTIQGQNLPWVIDGWTSVPGNITANLGLGDDALSLRNLDVGGNVTVDSGSGNDYVITSAMHVTGALDVGSASGNNSVFLTASHVGGPTEISTGGGVDAVWMDGNTFGGITVVNTGSGHDVGVFQNSEFAGSVDIDGAEGADWFAVSGNLTFGAAATIDGGSGHNAVDATRAVFPGQTPLISNFQQNGFPDLDAFLDQVMKRLSDVGLESLI